VKGNRGKTQYHYRFGEEKNNQLIDPDQSAAAAVVLLVSA
jgi:hypothetical protein